jgi:hypothetical protein
MGWQRDEIVTLLAILVIVVATISVGNLAGRGAQHAAVAPTASEDDPGCAEWTDGCVVCQRTAQGLACSTPGIACTRKAQACLRRVGA